MIVYYGELVRYKSLSTQICDYFEHTLECRNHTTDDDIVYPYSLWDIKGKLIAPTPYHSNHWDSKIRQYTAFNGCIPIPAYEVCEGFSELVALLMQHNKKVFVTKEHSASGEGNLIYDGNLKDVIQFRSEKLIRVSEYIPHKYDVSLHLIILNKKQFFISSIVEQIIEGTVFKGGKFPANINKNIIDRIHEYCAIIAEKLADTGYVGLCGVDFMVCENNDVYLCELNPRKMGTTPFISMQMEIDNNIPLSCIEYYVNILGELPDVKINKPTIGWEVRNIPYEDKYPIFPNNMYLQNVEKDKIYNDTYTKNSFKITKWNLSTL